MSLPPTYTPSSPSPEYSSSPLEDEQTVEFTPRGRTVTVPSGKLIKNCRFATIILKGQDANEELPSYGRNSLVCGEVGLNITDEPILSVSVKLVGRLILSVSDTGSSTTTIVSESNTLWTQDELGSDKCPSVLPFAIPFPPTFHGSDRTRPLPPSFDFISYELPAVCARCSYSLRLSIKRSPSRFAFWKPTKSYAMLLNYRPRTRPQRPVSHISTLFSTLKHMPEEWLQVSSTMRARSTADIQPISCHFFVPSAGTFGLSDNIPYHIQLSAPLSSIRHLFPDERSEATKPRSVRVYLTRQIVVEINSRQVWRSYSLGEGAVRSLPPPVGATPLDENDDNMEVVLDWEGEVRCNRDVNFGGFNIGNVNVKDFLVFSLVPPTPRTCPLLPQKYAHPIKLVTDTWVDTDTSHPSDV